MAGITYDPEKFQLNIIRFKKSGKRFEVVIDPDEYIQYKNNQVSQFDVLQSEDIFFDAQKGELASSSEIQAVFATTEEAIRTIFEKGEVHFTATFKKTLREKKKKQIIQLLLRNCIDARTRLPIPPARLDIALEKISLKIDEFKPASEQVKPVYAQLKEHIPITMEEKILFVQLPAKYASKSLGLLQKFATVQDQSFKEDGSVSCKVCVPSGVEQELYDAVHSFTHGSVTFEVVQTNIL